MASISKYWIGIVNRLYHDPLRPECGFLTECGMHNLDRPGFTIEAARMLELR